MKRTRRRRTTRQQKSKYMPAKNIPAVSGLWNNHHISHQKLHKKQPQGSMSIDVDGGGLSLQSTSYDSSDEVGLRSRSRSKSWGASTRSQRRIPNGLLGRTSETACLPALVGTEEVRRTPSQGNIITTSPIPAVRNSPSPNPSSEW